MLDLNGSNNVGDLTFLWLFYVSPFFILGIPEAASSHW